MKYFIVLIIILAITGTGSAKVSEYADSFLHKKHKMTIKEVLEKHTDDWMEIPGVIGTGEGKSVGKPCIVIFMQSNSESIKKKIPKKVDGFKVIFQETGEVKAVLPKK